MKEGRRSKVKGQSHNSKAKFTVCYLLLIACLLTFQNTSFSQTKRALSSVGWDVKVTGTKLELDEKLLRNYDENYFDGQPTVMKKSPGLAAFASLVVPGLGELYAGRYDIGKYSTIMEASLWVFYAAMEVYSSQVRTDAINYAKVYAGAQVEGKPDQFFVDVGNYLNTNDYDIGKIQQGENYLIYDPVTMPSYQWQWQSDADRSEFKRLRIKADAFLNYGRYTAAVIIFNHIISAFDAARLTVGVNASAATSLDGTPGTEGIYLKLAARF